MSKQIILTDLTADYFVNQKNARTIICSYCNQIITNLVYQNSECKHLRCYDCVFSEHKNKNKKCYVVCNTNNWHKKNDLTNNSRNLEVRCPIKECNKIFKLEDLASHNLTHIKYILSHRYPADIFLMIVTCLIYTLAIITGLSFPGFNKLKMDMYMLENRYYDHSYKNYEFLFFPSLIMLVLCVIIYWHLEPYVNKMHKEIYKDINRKIADYSI